MTSDDTFLNRWSRRKRQAAEAAPELAAEPTPAVDATPDAGEAAAPEPEKTDAEILEELGLRDPDEMAPGDDFSGFMSKAVPERLRNRALRKLWLTNPVLANLDELVDYGEDFTDAATVIENLQTVYRVGQGMIDRTSPEPEDDASGDEVPAPGASAEEPADETTEPVAEMPAESVDQAEPGQENIVQVEEDGNPVRISQDFADAEAHGKYPAPRRMRFHFNEE